MSAAFFLLAAQAGASLLQAHETSRAAVQQVGAGAYQARYAGLMERYQIQRQAQLDTRLRQDAFARAQGAQRAALGYAGVSGGRTAQLLEARSRTQYTQAQSEADISALLSTTASEYRERQQMSALRTGARQAIRQSQVDLLGSSLDVGLRGLEMYETGKAKK